MPSGHAVNIVPIVGVLGLLLFPRVGSPWLKFVLGGFGALLVLAVAPSRVYLKFHYPSDVAAGALLAGSGWARIYSFYTEKGGSWHRTQRKIN